MPTYIGAVPPEGAAPWDWEKTWKARAQKRDSSTGKTGQDDSKSPGDKGKK